MKTVSLSRITRLAIKTLGNMIKVARKERGISQENLAERLNVSRYTVIAIEKGDPKVAIGVAFEAAQIVGVKLLADDKESLQRIAQSLDRFDSILPSRIRNKDEPVDDNF